jgi:hypothetical protein
MTRGEFLRLVTCIFVVVSIAIGCEQVRLTSPRTKSAGHGPPPHAPAHGYRAKTAHGVEIVFDTGLGMYVVVGAPDNYYCAGRYYRRGSEGWEVTVEFHGEWQEAAESGLPAGLRSKRPGSGPKAGGKGKGKPK